ncbi:MAG: hypothetical protein ACI4SF_08275 [Oscillospiraceae bacterium]
MTNFEFLSDIPEYALFSKAAIEAEKVFSTSPAMCAVGCRKALELAVKWVYSADNTIKCHIRTISSHLSTSRLSALLLI